ncbi:MAG TPA: hypothetical protein DEQ47_05350 [Solibacterales bacterium]|nr:hypothetical protein [Bryobacterales bacterium]
MKSQVFEELLSSIRKVGAILRGEKKPSRRIVIDSTESDKSAHLGAGEGVKGTGFRGARPSR